MVLGKLQAITDVCILVDDIERTVDFYTNTLGFELRRRAEGFADFHGVGVTLAAWELDHINEHTGVVSNQRAEHGVNKVCVAVELQSPQLIDEICQALTDKGVKLLAPPKDYPWNARCAYFHDPDETLWEIYAWNGHPDDYHNTTGRKY